MAFFTRPVAASAIFAALALPALAQTSAPTPISPRHGHMMEGMHEEMHLHMREHMREHMRGHVREHMREYAGARLNALKAKLQLTPAQEPAWTAFTNAMQANDPHARLDAVDMSALTTPQRIDRMNAMRAQQGAAAERRGEATKTFYAALTPEQQKTFDEQTRQMHPMAGMGGMGGMENMRRDYTHPHREHGPRGMHGMPGPAQTAPATK